MTRIEYPHRPTLQTLPNDVFPHRPDYERPNRADDIQPGRVTAHAPRFEGTTFEQAQAALNHVQKEFHRHIETVNANRDHYTETGYREQIGNFTQTDAFKSMNHHLDQVRTRRDQAKADVDKIRSALVKPGDAAQESRNTRFWNRTQPKLDAAQTGASSLALKLIEQATPEQLSVLIEELPSYFEVRNTNLPDNHRKHATQSIDEAIDSKIQRTIPEYGSAAKKLGKAEQAVTIVEANADRLHRAITTGSQVPIALTTVPDGKYDPDK